MRDYALLLKAAMSWDPTVLINMVRGIWYWVGRLIAYIHIYIFGLASVPSFFSAVSTSATTTCYAETPAFALPELLILRLKPRLLSRNNKDTLCVPRDRKCKLWAGANQEHNCNDAFIPEYVKWPHCGMNSYLRPCISSGSILILLNAGTLAMNTRKYCSF